MKRPAFSGTDKIRRTRKTSLPTRTFNLCARFTPEEAEAAKFEKTRLSSRAADFGAFVDFWTEAEADILKLKKRKSREDSAAFARRKRDWAKLVRAKPQVDRIMVELFSGRKSPEEAVRVIRHLVPDNGLLKELFDIYDSAVKATPEQLAKDKAEAARRQEEIARREAELTQSTRLHRASGAVLSGLSVLSEAAGAGDAEAVKSLADAAVHAAFLLSAVEQKQPALARQQRSPSESYP